MSEVKPSGISSLVTQAENKINEIKREQNLPVTTKARNIGFVLFSVVGLFLAGLIALQIIAGIISLVIAFCGLVFMFYALRYLKVNDKYIKQKMRNTVIKKMIEEARKNKTETLFNLVVDSENRLKKAREGRDKMGGYLEKIKARLNKSDKTNSNYQIKSNMADRVEAAYLLIQKNTDAGAMSHKKLVAKVEEYKEMQEFTDIVGDAMSFANAKANTLDEMLGMEAFAVIEQDFHSAMVSIENSVSDFNIDNDNDN